MKDLNVEDVEKAEWVPVNKNVIERKFGVRTIVFVFVFVFSKETTTMSSI